jgi:hypothetical protein
MDKFVKECSKENLMAREGMLLNVTVQPTPFPRSAYEEVRAKQKAINKLLRGAMQDTTLLHVECKDRMFEILRNIALKRIDANPIQALFVRADYLLDKHTGTMKQVEINTISCSFAMYGPKLNRLHNKYHPTLISDSDTKFVDMIKQLKDAFEQLHKKENCVALLIDEKSDNSVSNYYEKIEIIMQLKSKGIDMLHITMGDVIANARFVAGSMFYSERCVFFVYYRWFYNATQYTEEDIDMRERIELSSVVSLPSVELQLVGLKVFQVIFKDKTILRRYLSNDEIDMVYVHFGDFKKSSEYEENDETRFILKSLGEGGNNVVTTGFSRYMDNNNYFLMRKIESPSFMNMGIRDKEQRPLICEVGVFGRCITVRHEVILNDDAGYIMRSKGIDSAECGVSCGYGLLDSIAEDGGNIESSQELRLQ